MGKKKKISPEQVSRAIEAVLPSAGIEKFAADPSFNDLDSILPGSQYGDLRNALRERGEAVFGTSKVVADFSTDGKVIAMAAAVPRQSGSNSEDWLKTNVPDFKNYNATLNNTLNVDFLTRRSRINLFYTIAKREGLVNNAIKKSAALIAQSGSFKIRYAKQGKRPSKSVSEDLMKLLSFWQDNVNSSDLNSAITGARGLLQIVRRGSRQALIEGDLFLRQVWDEVEVPILGKQYSLPILMQAIPTADIYVPLELGVGFEIFYWRPAVTLLGAFSSTDPNVKKIVNSTIPPKLRQELKDKGQVLLDKALLTHIKNGGTDSEIFGQSLIEPVLTDLAYSRSLKMLDFVTIDSLINRMLIIKIGDPNEKSDYHNLAVAQQRVNVFRRLLTGDIGPNMMIVWAGHDINKLDVSAHDSVLDTNQRHTIAKDNLKGSLGVPDSVLTGASDGGAKGSGWLGFVALNTVIEELREEFAQVITQLGRRIAVENGFDEVDLVWEFHKTLLPDREANSKIMLQAYDRGLLGRRTMMEELDKDFDAERIRRQEEEEAGDGDIFTVPILPTGGPAGTQGIAPQSQPGRPSGTGNPDKIGPDVHQDSGKPSKTS